MHPQDEHLKLMVDKWDNNPVPHREVNFTLSLTTKSFTFLLFKVTFTAANECQTHWWVVGALQCIFRLGISSPAMTFTHPHRL